MPNLREKLANGREKLSTKMAAGKEKVKLKVRVVSSKIREEWSWAGTRRAGFVLIAVYLLSKGWSFYSVIQAVIGLATLLFIGLPFLFKFTPAIQRNLVFLPFVRMPKNINFSKPADEGLPGTRNFYIQSESGVSIGVWHVLPQGLWQEGFLEEQGDDWWEDQLRDNRTVVLYLHGNTAHRAGDHRKELYRLLRSMDYHVIAFDYRGYADSSTHIAPTESGVVADARAVYDYCRDRVGTSRLIVWGHSLGTAISSHLVADLCLQDQRPCGLVLESPFNNIFDEVRNHPMAWVWRKMPWFDWFFTKPLAQNDVGFVSDQRVEVIDIPILILHAEDDLVVPFKLGKALYDHGVEKRPSSWPPITWKEFGGHHLYAHKYIYTAPELPNIVREFEVKCDLKTDIDDQ